MKQYERIKKDILKCNSSMWMIGYFNGIYTSALLYCQQNCPEEIIINEDESSTVSIYGMQNYLESEV